MKKVLITGGAGFIAHHIIAYIIKNTDWKIVTIDRLDISGNLNRLNEILEQFSVEDKKRLKIVFHDLKAEINSQIESAIGKPDIILHLAAASHVDRSITFPMEFVQDNVVGTVNLLDFARRLPKLEKFVYFSTDEIFGNAPEGVSYSEYDRYNSTNPYSASKASAEEFCVAYENTYKLPINITHTMNVFGERQHPEKFIPMTIQRVRDQQKVLIHANKEKTKAGSRHYIHAQDVADGLMFILNLKNYNHKGDFGNAKYWFRKVGDHPIFPSLASAAYSIDSDRFQATGVWDPYAFIDCCEEAAKKNVSDSTLSEVASVEWELLFAYCFQQALGIE